MKCNMCRFSPLNLIGYILQYALCTIYSFINSSLTPRDTFSSFSQGHHIVDLSLQDSNFITTLELAVRFGKTLVIQEMDGVEPVLYPLLRRDLIAQGK